MKKVLALLSLGCVLIPQTYAVEIIAAEVQESGTKVAPSQRAIAEAIVNMKMAAVHAGDESLEDTQREPFNIKFQSLKSQVSHLSQSLTVNKEQFQSAFEGLKDFNILTFSNARSAQPKIALLLHAANLSRDFSVYYAEFSYDEIISAMHELVLIADNRKLNDAHRCYLDNEFQFLKSKAKDIKGDKLPSTLASANLTSLNQVIRAWWKMRELIAH